MTVRSFVSTQRRLISTNEVTMINDNTMRPRIDLDIVFVDEIVESIEKSLGKKEFNIYHHSSDEIVGDLIGFYGKKMDEDMAAGIFDTKYLRMFEIVVNIRNGVIYR